MQEETFVLIVGGGPVGLAAAIDLGWRGVPTILMNARATTSVHPKCNHTNTRSMEHFRRLDVAGRIRAAHQPGGGAREYEYVTRFCGYELGRLPRQIPLLKDGKVTGGAAALHASPEPGHNIPQPKLEQVLKAAAEDQGVEVAFGWRIVSFEETADAVVASAEQRDTGARREIRARYVIGADGGSSLVRRTIGAELHGEDGREQRAFMGGTMLSYHVEAPSLLEAGGRPIAAISWIVSPSARGFAFLQDGGTRWIFHYQLPPGVSADSVVAEDVVRLLIGRDDVPFTILSGGPWTGGLALAADRYQRGRLSIVGDAAHLYTPLGGLGMNTGIGDAMNLGWKLAAAHQGWAGEGLVASYEAERKPIGARNAELGLKYARIHSRWRLPNDIETEGEAAEAHRRAFGEAIIAEDRDQFVSVGATLGDRYEGSPIICGDGTPAPPDSLSDYTPIDRAGGRLPHATIDDRALIDEIGRGFTLLNFSGADASLILEAAEKRGVPLRYVALPAPPAESGITSALVLVRPDGYVAWRGAAAPDDPSALIDQVRGG